MWKLPIRLLAAAGVLALAAQESDDEFGAAVKRSLERARALYPQSAEPGTPLSKAVLSRIDWLHRYNQSMFADPNWPLRVTSTEAAALGIPPRRPSPSRPRPDDGRRFLAVVTQNFSTAGASFRKNQQIVLESVQDYGKRGTTVVNDRPLLLWLDNIRILREISGDDDMPVVVKIESAGYGIPGGRAYSVTTMVQSLINPDHSGRYEILVSDALLTPGAAKMLRREINAANPVAGQHSADAPNRVLTVTYTLRGLTKTKQALAGERLVLD